MSAKTFGILACRILALYSVIQAIKYIQTTFYQIATISTMDEVLFSILFAVLGAVTPVLLLVGFSIALWRYARTISARMIMDIEAAEAAGRVFIWQDWHISG